eukprot:PhM_4_TR6123/c0_g1_i1/m.4573
MLSSAADSQSQREQREQQPSTPWCMSARSMTQQPPVSTEELCERTKNLLDRLKINVADVESLRQQKKRQQKQQKQQIETPFPPPTSSLRYQQEDARLSHLVNDEAASATGTHNNNISVTRTLFNALSPPRNEKSSKKQNDVASLQRSLLILRSLRSTLDAIADDDTTKQKQSPPSSPTGLSTPNIPKGGVTSSPSPQTNVPPVAAADAVMQPPTTTRAVFQVPEGVAVASPSPTAPPQAENVVADNNNNTNNSITGGAGFEWTLHEHKQRNRQMIEMLEEGIRSSERVARRPTPSRGRNERPDFTTHTKHVRPVTAQAASSSVSHISSSRAVSPRVALSSIKTHHHHHRGEDTPQHKQQGVVVNQSERHHRRRTGYATETNNNNNNNNNNPSRIQEQPAQQQQQQQQQQHCYHTAEHGSSLQANPPPPPPPGSGGRRHTPAKTYVDMLAKRTGRHLSPTIQRGGSRFYQQ